MISAQVYIVTGASAGIGMEIAKGIASLGHFVVLGCRNKEKGQKAIEAIVASGIEREKMQVMVVDTSSQTSIKKFASDFKKQHNNLHCLVNNAAIGGPPSREFSEDGLELTFATNVMGYYYLIECLSDILLKSAPSRIVNVASNYAGGLDLSDINYERRKYDNTEAYRESKQADRMISWIYAEKFKNQNITVNACHPGVIKTQLLDDLGFSSSKPPSQGAETPLWLATSKEMEGVTNKYWDSKRESSCSFRSEKALSELLKKLREWTKVK